MQKMQYVDRIQTFAIRFKAKFMVFKSIPNFENVFCTLLPAHVTPIAPRLRLTYETEYVLHSQLPGLCSGRVFVKFFL